MHEPGKVSLLMAYEQLSRKVVERIRDGAIHALDDLNLLLEEVQENLEPDDARALRLATAQACSAILEQIVEPLLRAHPQCDLPLPQWEEVALAHRRRRDDRS